MDRLGDDLLASVLRRVGDRRDRKSCSQVSRQWFQIEAATRPSLRILDPSSLPKLLPRFPNLTTLDLNGRIPSQTLRLISTSCPGLRVLNLGLHRTKWELESESEADEDDFDGDGLAGLSVGCRDLTKVSLRRRKGITDLGVSKLVASARNLGFLDLSWCCGITDGALDAVGGMSSLTELRLHGCSHVTDSGLEALAGGSLPRSLRVLDLAECDRITDAGVCCLQRMCALQELSLADCGVKITDVGGVAVSSLSGIRRLDLSWLINVSDATLVSVARSCLDLVEIKLVGCEMITGAGVRPFADHGSLEALVVASCCGIGVDDVRELVSGCRSLRYVGLDKCMLHWMSAALTEELRRLCVDWL